MERTIPQKVNSVPSCNTEIATPTGQKQAPTEGTRRNRTSVAMIGLAISMGAHSLLLPQPNDGAIAAEPVPGELTTAEAAVNVAAASHSPAGATAATGKASVIEHTVQEGQTLQQLARFYGVDAIAVASANGLSLEAVLRVGQVLRIPTNSLVARVPQSSSASPEYYGLVSGEPPAPPLSASNSTDAALKIQQDEALSRLSQKRENLRLSLSQIKPGPQQPPAAIAEQPQASASAVLAAQPSKLAEAAISEPLPPAAGQPSPSRVFPAPALEQRSQATPPQATPPQEAVVALTDSVNRAEVKSVPTTSMLANSGSYQVNPGDTLSAIARAYSIPEAQLAAANKITNPNLIRANQILKVPQRQSSTASAPASVSVPIGSEKLVVLADVPVIGASANGVQPDTARLIETRLQQAQSASSISRLPAQVSVETQPDRIATALTGTTRSEAVVVATPNYSYVENLKSELLRLREKYGATAPQTVAKVETASIAPVRAPESVRPEPVNPEFNPQASALSVRLPARKVQETAPAIGAQPQKVATASLGSQSYSSLTSSMLGQMVSPTLPPLGSAEAYLPGKSGKFAGYIWPAQGMLSSGYGWRWGRMHRGIDIAAPVGTPIVAAAGGKVTYADWNSGGYGNLVEITHSDGSVTLYAHNNRILVREGQEVSQGEQIAEMGSTGYSTGPHSHFEVHLPGQGAVNPIGYLPGNGAS